jgi:HIRAN domain
MSDAARSDTPLPPPQPPKELRLRTNVHGSVFAARTSVVSRLAVGDRLLLVPDPPADSEPPAVWVHVAGGDVLGHVPVQVAAWLAPWMLAGGRCAARVAAVRGDDVASWNRIEIELERTVPTP